MLRPALSLICLLAMLPLAACGGDDDSSDGPLGKAELAAAADEVCADADARFARSGPRGITNPGLAAEFENTTEIVAARQRGFERLEPAAAVEEDYERFLRTSAEVVAADRALAEAAAADDSAAVGRAFGRLGRAVDARDRAAENLGMKVCGGIPEPVVEETGTGPVSDVGFAEPANTVGAALEDLLAAAENGDCNAINAAEHSDNRPLGRRACAAIADAYAGAKVLATEEYGPAAAVEIETRAQPFTVYFVTDTGRVLRRGGDVVVDDGGLRPANEEIDADRVAEEAVRAIRASDPAAFNRTLSVDDQSFRLKPGEFDAIGDGPSGDDLVAAIRADEDVVPQPLGENQAYAFFLLDTDADDFVLVLAHEPGSETAYRLRGFFPVPRS
jgi:hypothetical protein